MRFRSTLVTLLCLGCCVLATTAETIGEQRLFQLIDQRSRALKTGELQLLAADRSVNVAESARLPEVSAAWQPGYLGNALLTDRGFGNVHGIANPHFLNNFALDAYQILYTGGAVTEGINMARLQREAAATGVETARSDVRLALLGALVDLQLTFNRSRVINVNIANTLNILDNIRARYEQGVVLLSDVTRYEVQLERLRLQHTEAAQDSAQITLRLVDALQLPIGEPVMPSLNLPDGPSDEHPLEWWQIEASAHNPQLALADNSVAMSETAIRLERAALYPKLGFYAYGRLDSPITIEVPMLDKNYMSWGFGLNLSYSLSSLWTAKKRVGEAKASSFAATEARDLQAEQVRTAVDAAWHARIKALAALDTQRKTVELAQQNYDIVADRFTNGLALITDMVDAANVLLSAQLALEDARASLLFSTYRLRHAAGIL